jgi:hypothetical protein
MATKITDTEMSSDQTRHTAAVVPGAVIEGGPTAWSVSWLPGRLLLRNQAITAMVLAEAVGAALDPYAAERVWPFIEGWAAELGLSDVDAVAMASLPPEYHAEESR